jgi:flagellar biosynthesis protein FlhF
MLVTRLDMVHRLGSILAAADANRLAFSDIGTSPSIADGLSPLNPVALARFLMPDMAAKRAPAATAPTTSSQPKTRQALS